MAVSELSGACRVGVVAAEGVHTDDLSTALFEPARRGATTHLVAADGGSIRSMDAGGLAESYHVDAPARLVHPDDYDALVVPGGGRRLPYLDDQPELIELIRWMLTANKVVGLAACEAGLIAELPAVEGRRMTSIEAEHGRLITAGAVWMDEPVVVDAGLVTTQDADFYPVVRAVVTELVARDTDTDIATFRQAGPLPEALAGA